MGDTFKSRLRVPALAAVALATTLAAGSAGAAPAKHPPRVTIAHHDQRALLHHGLAARIRVKHQGRLTVSAVVWRGHGKAGLRTTRARVKGTGQRVLRLSLAPASRRLVSSCDRTKVVVKAVLRTARKHRLVRMSRQAIVTRNSVACRPAAAEGGPDPNGARKPMILDAGVTALTGSRRKGALNQAASLGVDFVRMEVQWASVAPAHPTAAFDAANPADPEYSFTATDGFMRAAAARGLAVNVLIRGPAPNWASDTTDRLSPRPADFGTFAGALAARYSGRFDPAGNPAVLPAASMFSLWNEPNLSAFLRPQFRNGDPYSPILYRRMYMAGQAAVQASAPGVPILIGETAPTGSYNSVDPADFARGVLCVDAYAKATSACDGGSIDAIGWSTHPYSVNGAAPFDPSLEPDHATIGDLSQLETALDQGASAGRIAAAFPVWISESGIQSDPDENGVPAATQADYISIAEYLAYSDPRVASAAQYLLWDDAQGSGTVGRAASFQTGLRYADGEAKPSLTSFGLPLVARRDGSEVALWGLVRPASGPVPVTIRARDGSGEPWTVTDASTSASGMLTASASWGPSRQWQLVWHSPSGDVSGEWTSSYSFGVSPSGVASPSSSSS